MREVYRRKGHSRDRRGNGDDRVREEAVLLRAQRLAIEIAERMDSLVSRSWAEARLQRIAQRIEGALLELVPKLAPEIADERDPDAVRRLLEREFAAVRYRLADELEGVRP
jgi:hypothetical protein